MTTPAFQLIPATIVRCPTCGVDSEAFTEPISEAAVNRWKLQHGAQLTCLDCGSVNHSLAVALGSGMGRCFACQARRDADTSCECCGEPSFGRTECDDCRTPEHERGLEMHP